MADVHVKIPVFVPGTPKGFKNVAGVASISETGEIRVTLSNPADGVELANNHKKGKIFAVSLDYLPEEEEPERIPEAPQVELTSPEA